MLLVDKNESESPSIGHMLDELAKAHNGYQEGLTNLKVFLLEFLTFIYFLSHFDTYKNNLFRLRND